MYTHTPVCVYIYIYICIIIIIIMNHYCYYYYGGHSEHGVDQGPRSRAAARASSH